MSVKVDPLKFVKIILAVTYCIAAIVVCQQIIFKSLTNQKSKADYAELNDIKYGLFSVDEWKDRLVEIVSDEFDRLYVSSATEAELREHTAVILNKMIDEAAAKIKKSNEKTTTGKIKQAFINLFVDMDDIKKGIPAYTEAVIQEMKKKKTKEQMKTLVNSQMQAFAAKTKDIKDQSRLQRIFKSVGTNDIESARKKIAATVAATYDAIVRQTIHLIILIAIPFLILIWGKSRPSPLLFAVLIVALVVLLVAGVTTPMIDMEAKISQLEFILLGHAIVFDNQVLYFQSKSILDVFWVMITHAQLQMKLVGVLLLTFSVFFPLLKLILSVITYCHVRWAQNNPVVKFFVFKSGKWSMTDVMVVAIFMAYIGFNGVIGSQLKTLQSLETDVRILTTNGTSLQPGYFLFLTYAVLAIFLSSYLLKTSTNLEAKSHNSAASPKNT